MNIIKRMETLKQEYNQNRQHINALLDRQKNLEGAFTILLELGVEQGVLDQNGNPIVEEEHIEEPE